MSNELRLYVFETVRHAAQLVTDYNYRVPRQFLEAIDLAFEIRENDKLACEILELKTENDFAPELAQRLLHQIRTYSARDSTTAAR
jgi:hypothetical protein